jgi:hypothetical protein
MHRVRLTCMSLILLTFIPYTLNAQYGRQDDGQYTIVSAQYGTARRHVDVTNRLKQLARQDRTFKMGNQVFGVDPDPGQIKTLRIYATDPNGRERMFEYREYSIVDGAMFRGWNTGQWGNGRWSGRWEGDHDQDDYGARRNDNGYGNPRGDAGRYVIEKAEFGTARHHVDVTDRLKQLARQDVSFRMDFRSLGVDPDPRRRKMLRIFARDQNGRERTFDYPEFSTIDGAMFRSWQSGNWGYDRRERQWEDRR